MSPETQTQVRLSVSVVVTSAISALCSFVGLPGAALCFALLAFTLAHARAGVE